MPSRTWVASLAAVRLLTSATNHASPMRQPTSKSGSPALGDRGSMPCARLQAAQTQRLFVDRRDVFIEIARGNEAARPALDRIVGSGATTVVMLSPSRLARDGALLVRRLAMLRDAGIPIVFADGMDVTVLVPHAATSGSEWWTSALRRHGLAGRVFRLCQRRYARIAASWSAWL